MCLSLDSFWPQGNEREKYIWEHQTWFPFKFSVLSAERRVRGCTLTSGSCSISWWGMNNHPPSVPCWAVLTLALNPAMLKPGVLWHIRNHVDIWHVDGATSIYSDMKWAVCMQFSSTMERKSDNTPNKKSTKFLRNTPLLPLTNVNTLLLPWLLLSWWLRFLCTILKHDTHTSSKIWTFKCKCAWGTVQLPSVSVSLPHLHTLHHGW